MGPGLFFQKEVSGRPNVLIDPRPRAIRVGDYLSPLHRKKKMRHSGLTQVEKRADSSFTNQSSGGTQDFLPCNSAVPMVPHSLHRETPQSGPCVFTALE